MLDSNGIITKNITNATQYVYNITMVRTISGKSSSNFIISKVSTQSTIKVSYIQQSSTPLSGNFIINCIDSSGNAFKSQSIVYNENYMSIQYKLMIGCPFLYDKI